MSIGTLHSLLHHRAVVELKLCSSDFFYWFIALERRSERTYLQKMDSYFRQNQADMISNLLRIIANNSPQVVGSVLSGFVYGASKSDFVGAVNGRVRRELFQFRYAIQAFSVLPLEFCPSYSRICVSL
jgi:predicted AAA+ superfamily ATPase